MGQYHKASWPCRLEGNTCLRFELFLWCCTGTILQATCGSAVQAVLHLLDMPKSDALGIVQAWASTGLHRWS